MGAATQSSLLARNSSTGPPELIAVDGRGALQFWPIAPDGGNHPQRISQPLGIGYAGGIAAHGNVLAIAGETPAQVVTYNVATGQRRVLADTFGTPVDIAIDKKLNLFVANISKPVGNVTMFTPGSQQGQKLSCKYINLPEAIAVDNEGDIFTNGYGPQNRAGVVEIPNGPNGPEPQNCSLLALKAQPGYIGGLAVDPRTDALIVLDDPDLCAGGVEGRMTIYVKPYSKTTAVSHDLGANCAGGIHLDAQSTRVFVGDSDVSGSYSYVLQRSYPDGKNMGAYYGGNPGAVTTIPNTLPN